MVSGHAPERPRGETYCVPLTYKCKQGHDRKYYRAYKPRPGRKAPVLKCRACERIHNQKNAGRSPVNKVDNAPLRDAVLRALERDKFLTWFEISDRAGFSAGSKVGDTHLKRMLGIKPQVCGKSKNAEPYYSTEIREEYAVRICRAIHVDPWEVGI